MSVVSGDIANAMTVDVEDYFQVSAFENFIPRNKWGNCESRIERNTNRILDIFADSNVEGTFFTLGWIAKHYPHLVRRIVDEGHELASHGYDHTRVTQQNETAFREDVIRAKKILEDVSGRRIIGYRAASYSITRKNMWALDILDETGHKYSSSIYPVKHDLYGIPDAPRFPFYPHGNDGILEIPITTININNKNYPGGGGGFFRLYPYFFTRFVFKRINQKDEKPGIFYFHLWEIDPDQPRPQAVLPLKTRIRHYLNLNRTEERLKRLLNDFEWGRMDRIFLPDNGNH